jgi:hypothetical protein
MEAHMYNTIAFERESVWNNLQEPARGLDLAPVYLLLLSALDGGWRVEEPVDLRYRWGDEGPRVYHFLLRPPLSTGQLTKRLITVAETPEIQRFVANMGWRVLDMK